MNIERGIIKVPETNGDLPRPKKTRVYKRKRKKSWDEWESKFYKALREGIA